MSKLAQLQDVFDEVFESRPIISEDTQQSDIEEWDSINHLSLILALEETFGKKFSIEQIEASKSVRQILAFL